MTNHYEDVSRRIHEELMYEANAMSSGQYLDRKASTMTLSSEEEILFVDYEAEEETRVEKEEKKEKKKKNCGLQRHLLYLRQRTLQLTQPTSGYIMIPDKGMAYPTELIRFGRNQESRTVMSTDAHRRKRAL
ncbi:uncharacterized protein [Periplaneta americana]|uniref:uncharacterized protein isoform X2 n=1 Tax=Periplaneta americana TaxID=6978 RepID=UPI0037E84E2C